MNTLRKLEALISVAMSVSITACSTPNPITGTGIAALQAPIADATAACETALKVSKKLPACAESTGAQKGETISPGAADSHERIRKAMDVPRFPCSIQSVATLGEGVRLRFFENVFWSFEDSAGEGIIGVGGVKRFIVDSDGHTVAIQTEPDLFLKYGQELELRGHHLACSITVIPTTDRPLLRASWSTCLTGIGCRTRTAEQVL